jgi:large subunit ribosomal protein L6
MSRIGKMPVAIPKGVTVTADGTTVTVKGTRGELKKTFHPDLGIKVDGGNVIVTRPSDEKLHKSLHGLTRTLISNMIEGVTAGYSKTLEIAGVGYKAEPRPYGLQFALGYSHPIEYRAPAGIKLSAPNPTTVQVEGADKEIVGQVAAEIRSLRPPEPYKGKGIKYLGEVIRRKAGKAGGK